jgi:peptidoglycan/xylan/chitin deacetylase (PgdA/CDA1 family)
MLQQLGIGTATLLTQGFSTAEKSLQNPKKHIITLSFDDGIKKSSIKTAELFEKHKLQACINVIATGHLSSFKIPDPGHLDKKGDFVLWNELKSRGHEIMPHTYTHVNFAQIPFDKAKEEIDLCLDYFSKNLKGFDLATSIYNFAYNESTPQTEAYLMDKVRAFRTDGKEINQMPHKGQKKLTCGAFGPGNSEKYLEDQIAKLQLKEIDYDLIAKEIGADLIIYQVIYL